MSALMGILGLTAGVGQSVLNYVGQKKTNKQNIDFQREMWEKNRQAALDDARAQNEYNSPEQTMQRLKEAGLSGNLVYGNGGANNTAAMIRSSQGEKANLTTPQLENLPEALAAAQNMNLVRAQIRNTEAQTLSTIANANKTKTEDSQLQETIGLKMEQLIAQTGNIEANTAHTQGREERAKASFPTELEGKVLDNIKTRLANSKTEKEKEMLEIAIENAKKDGRIKEYTATLADNGINPNDPLWARMIVEMLGGMKIMDVLKKFIF